MAEKKELTQKELDVLAYTLLGEAAGEGREGMEAVMNVIMNRSRSGRFPDNPASVATQKDSRGVYQFSAWNKKSDGGNAPRSSFRKDSPEFQQALEVVQRVMAGEVEDTTGGATHYYSGDEKPYWFDAEAEAGEIQIGNHRFAARNTDVDTAENALDAATLLGNGRLKVRPASAYAPQPERTPQGNSGLTTRKVQTVEVDESTGRPYTPQAPVGLAAALENTARQRATQEAANREAQRLASIRIAKMNENDLRGEEARVSTTNTASSAKQERRRAADQSGEAARAVIANKASATKTARAAAPAAPPVTARDNVASARAEQRRPASTPKSGVTKTAGTQLPDGTRLALAGEVAMPRDVRPKVPVPTEPKPVTRFIKPVQPATKQQVAKATPFALPNAAGNLQPEPDKRLPKTDVRLQPTARQNVNVQRSEQTLRRKATTVGGKTPAITPPDPTLEEVVAVRDTRGPRRAAGRQIAPQNPITRIPPPTATPAQMLAQAMRQNGNFLPGQVAAMAAGQKGYIASDGRMMPTTSIGGAPRNTYGDMSPDAYAAMLERQNDSSKSPGGSASWQWW